MKIPGILFSIIYLFLVNNFIYAQEWGEISEEEWINSETQSLKDEDAIILFDKG